MTEHYVVIRDYDHSTHEFLTDVLGYVKHNLNHHSMSAEQRLVKNYHALCKPGGRPTFHYQNFTHIYFYNTDDIYMFVFRFMGQILSTSEPDMRRHMEELDKTNY
jgi:hypothetical protein